MSKDIPPDPTEKCVTRSSRYICTQQTEDNTTYEQYSTSHLPPPASPQPSSPFHLSNGPARAAGLKDRGGIVRCTMSVLGTVLSPSWMAWDTGGRALSSKYWDRPRGKKDRFKSTLIVQYVNMICFPFFQR